MGKIAPKSFYSLKRGGALVLGEYLVDFDEIVGRAARDFDAEQVWADYVDRSGSVNHTGYNGGG